MLRRRLAVVAVLAAGAAATVGVLEGSGSSPRAEPRTAVPVCAGADAVSLACQQDRYSAIVRLSGVPAAFAGLKEAYEREGFVRAGCHPIVHAIGHAAVARYGDDLPRVYARGDPFCSAGYFHGVTEQIVVDIGAGRFLASAPSLCGDVDESIYRRNCAHGIGHGFLLVLNGDLPAALGTCDVLDARREQRSCYGGVFMQNVMSLEQSDYLRPDDPMYPCNELARRHRAMCYEKQTGYALFASNGDVSAVFALCADVRPAFRAPCHEGLGTSIAVHHLKQVVRDRDLLRLTVRACDLGRSAKARASCIGGAARALINYDHAVLRARALCAAARRSLRTGCENTIRAKRDYPE